MARQFKLARKMKKIKPSDAQKEFGVSQTTLSAWEGERKNPSLDTLCHMADYYGVSTDFLLGRETEWIPPRDDLQPIPPAALPALHGQPAWSERYGWVLIDSVEKRLITVDQGTIPFVGAQDIFVRPPAFSVGYQDLREPLTLGQVKACTKTWVEPISGDAQTRDELRGWYRVNAYFVQNEYGNRFYLDTYGAKWLAFDSELA